jgi:hypothetical protein
MPLDVKGCVCKYTTYTTLLAPHPTPPHHTKVVGLLDHIELQFIEKDGDW